MRRGGAECVSFASSPQFFVVVPSRRIPDARLFHFHAGRRCFFCAKMLECTFCDCSTDVMSVPGAHSPCWVGAPCRAVQESCSNDGIPWAPSQSYWYVLFYNVL